ncbi:hypothetical protein [uncultured Erythrobacter sp.]|uniref:hypothetical protein n=1 Tax=uncultured Erythrobacter sp. TaxID=263913 RepID=UPI00261F1FB7|nr:hypothetical protein [uncultured Erythrobacter sp.]
MKILALFALVPIASGPLPQEERTLTLDLCLGGEITIPLGDKDSERPNEHDGGCHTQACHAGTCRQKEKPVRR